ncbi:Hypothetical protein BN2458_PEG0812 [Helicobacter typhlonius]|uniref:Uncharacterized protein n=1 Tax=Helicobacter typhlonius TaxID=76936 RepID=A0A0S4PWX0_9HELI|nr:Hypothetical protein BN2458_PEG0812 [Helicobacter typhlonius]
MILVFKAISGNHLFILHRIRTNKRHFLTKVKGVKRVILAYLRRLPFDKNSK